MPTGIYKRTKPPWNKGKKGLPSSWNKGIPHSDELKEKLRQAKLKNPVRYWKGKKRPEVASWIIPAVKGKPSKRKGVKLPQFSGENSSSWKGGVSRGYKTGYYSLEYKQWRESVFKRDKYTCQDCGFHGSKGYITAHHIKSFARFPKLRYSLSNGKTLCEPCHAKTDNYKGRAKGKLIHNS